MMIATASLKIEILRQEMNKVRESQKQVEKEKRRLLEKNIDKCGSKSASKNKG